MGRRRHLKNKPRGFWTRELLTSLAELRWTGVPWKTIEEELRTSKTAVLSQASIIGVEFRYPSLGGNLGMNSIDLRRLLWEKRIKPRLIPAGKCLEYLPKRKTPYGMVGATVDSVPVNFLAHRVTLEVKIGRILKPGEMACHKCDNKSCCNPSHLYVGSKSTNGNDWWKRAGRAKDHRRQKSNHGRSILTLRQVAAIKLRLSNDETRASIARRFGVSWWAINDILRGYTWPRAKAAK
jgi:hypothetical protein